jgi:hypothetical protein
VTQAARVEVKSSFGGSGLMRERIDPRPLYGAAVLSNKARLALYLLSDKGQAIIAKQGLVPLAEAPKPPQ